MPQPEPVLRKLIVDQQYEPSLQIFSCMDSVGIALASSFPEWNRGPSNLELFNRTKHQRLVVNHRQVAFEADSPGTEDERVEIITAVMKASESGIGFPKFARFSVHGFFVAATQESLASLCERVERNFLTAASSIPAFQGAKMTDVSYVISFETENWKYAVRLGPMDRNQWFQSLFYDMRIYDLFEVAGSFVKFVQTMPERFLFIDIEAFQDGIAFQDAFKNIRYLDRQIFDLAHKLTAHCWS
jgi:hypothetical protein